MSTTNNCLQEWELLRCWDSLELVENEEEEHEHVYSNEANVTANQTAALMLPGYCYIHVFFVQWVLWF